VSVTVALTANQSFFLHGTEASAAHDDTPSNQVGPLQKRERFNCRDIILAEKGLLLPFSPKEIVFLKIRLGRLT